LERKVFVLHIHILENLTVLNFNTFWDGWVVKGNGNTGEEDTASGTDKHDKYADTESELIETVTRRDWTIAFLPIAE